MSLLEDIKIYFDAGNLADRLSITDGTIKREGLEGRSRYFPNNHWSAFPSKRLNILSLPAGATWQTGKHIGLVPFPETVWKPLSHFLRRFEPHFFSDLNFLSEHSDDYVKALSLIIDYLPNILLSAENLITIGTVFNQPGLETTTINTNLKLPTARFENQTHYTGLHVDSRDTPAPERHWLPNLLLLNLGTEPRYLLFVNLTIEKMLELVFENPPGLLDTLDLKFKVKQLFFDQYPNYPVLRLRIEPGEAYIAPYENMFHDGSTLDKLQPDVVQVFQGKFAPSPKILQKIY